MVRHLVSKHGIPPAIAQMTTGSGSRSSISGSLDLKSGGGLAGLQQMGGGGAGGGGSTGDCGASVGSAGSHNGCESPIPENLSLRKENYENENLSGSRCTSPLPPHIMPIPTYGLTGAITAISAAAAVVEEQAAAAAAAAAIAEAQAKNNNESGGGRSEVDDEDETLAAQAEAVAALGIKPEPVTPSKVQHLMNEEWNMKLGLQIISNSLLKERLMNTMPFAYNNN